MPNKGNRKPDRPSAEDSKEELTNFMTPKRPTYPTPRRDTRLPSRPRGRPAIVQTSGRPLQGVTQPQKTKIPKMKTEAQHKSQTSSGLILPSEAAVPQKAQNILQETRGQQKATRRKNQIIRSERQKREEKQKSKIRLPAELQLGKPLRPKML